jgi:hypothetical protein
MTMWRALVIPALLLFGCAHHYYDENHARAEYEHERAVHDLEHGHPVGAVKHETRSKEAEHEAEEHYRY